jgi:predicted GNAT superfamily acetyltransferase
MMKIYLETWASLRKDCEELAQLHWDEIAWDKDKVPLDPNWELYAALEHTGKLVCVTAREDGKLWGYSVFIVQGALHYRTTLTAINDVLFLHPDKRHSRVGLSLINKSEEFLQARGVRRVFWHVKPGVHDFSPVLLHKGYRLDEIVYSKVLGD